MKFSVITPTLNQGKYIEKTIKSVLGQKGVELEYIVIDGKSGDNTLNILKKYRNKLRYISEKDSGQSAAINKGFRMAKGEILAWINSDDWYSQGALRKVERYFEEHPKVDILYGDWAVADNKGKVFKKIKEIDFNKNIYLHGVNYICQPTVFFRKKVWRETGTVNEKLHLAMDVDYWKRTMIKGFKWGHIRELVAVVRIHNQAKSIRQKREQKLESDLVWGYPALKFIYRIERQIFRLLQRGQLNFFPFDWSKKWH